MWSSSNDPEIVECPLLDDAVQHGGLDSVTLCTDWYLPTTLYICHDTFDDVLPWLLLYSSLKILLRWTIEKLLVLFAGHSLAVRVLCQVGESTVWSGSDDTTLRVWSVLDMSLKCVMQGHKGPVCSIVDMGSHVWSGSWDKNILVWDIVTYQLLFSLGDQGGCVKVLRLPSVPFRFSFSNGYEIWPKCQLLCIWQICYNSIYLW